MRLNNILYSITFLFSFYANAIELEGSSLDDIFAIEITSADVYQKNKLNISESVYQVTQKDWDSSINRGVFESLNFVPGVELYKGVGGVNRPVLRGFANSNARGLGTLVDGIPLDTNSSSNAFYSVPDFGLGNLKKVEVIKGPGSSIYGSDSFLGVIGLYTYDPNVEETKVSVEAGHFGHYDSYFRTSKKFNDDWKISVSLSLSGQNDIDETIDGKQVGKFGGSPETEVGDARDNYSTKTFVSHLSKKNHKLSVYYIDGKKEGYHIGASDTGTLDATGAVAGSENTIVISKYSNQFELGKSHSIKNRIFYWDSDSLRLRDNVGPIPLQKQNMLFENNIRSGIRSILYNNYNPKSDQLNQEYFIGVEYDYQKTKDAYETDINYYSSFPTPGDVLVSGSTRRYSGVSRNLRSIFAQYNIDWSTRYYLNLGSRLDSIDGKDSRISPRVGLVWMLTDEQALKFNYSNAFRNPSSAEEYGSSQTFSVASPDLRLERINNYEIKYALDSFRFQFETSLFFVDWNDAIEQESVSVGVTKSVNSDSNRSYGIESVFRYKDSKHDLEINGSYINGENEDTGIHYLATPMFIFNSIYTYTFSEKLTFGLKAKKKYHQYANSAFNGAANNKISNYGRLDIFANYLKNKMNYFVKIQNLTNSKNILSSPSGDKSGIKENGIATNLGFSYKF